MTSCFSENVAHWSVIEISEVFFFLIFIVDPIFIFDQHILRNIYLNNIYGKKLQS